MPSVAVHFNGQDANHTRVTRLKAYLCLSLPWLLGFSGASHRHMSRQRPLLHSRFLDEARWMVYGSTKQSCKTLDRIILSAAFKLQSSITGGFPGTHLRYDHCSPPQKFSLPCLWPFSTFIFWTPPRFEGRPALTALSRTVILLIFPLAVDWYNMSRALWQSGPNGSPRVEAQVQTAVIDRAYSRHRTKRT